MGISIRYFWFDEKDAAHRIPTAKWERVHNGKDGLPQLAGRQVPIAWAFIDVDGRRVRDVMRVHAWVYWFDADGRLNQERAREGHLLVLDSMDDMLHDPKAKVRPLGPKIAGRRVDAEFRYKLTRGQTGAVMDAILGRSRRAT